MLAGERQPLRQADPPPLQLPPPPPPPPPRPKVHVHVTSVAHTATAVLRIQKVYRGRQARKRVETQMRVRREAEERQRKQALLQRGFVEFVFSAAARAALHAVKAASAARMKAHKARPWPRDVA